MARTDAPVSIMMPIGLKEEITALAKKHQRSITQELIIATREYVERESSPYSIAAQAQTESDIFAAQERRMQELENQMMLIQMQISEIKQPCITQTAGRDAKMNVTKE